MTEVRQFRQHRFVPPPGSCEILLVRHGESTPHVEGEPFTLVDGHGDPELAREGRAQAALVADRLTSTGEKITAIYVTTLRRTHETAAPLAERLGIEPQVEPDLREVFLGEWEGGELRRRVTDKDPLAAAMFEAGRWDVIPGAETNEAFATRVRAGLERVIAAHRGQRVVVVVHGGVIGQCMSLATGAPTFNFMGADNASISQIVAMPAGFPSAASGPTGWTVRRFNDTAHLDPVFSIASEPLT